MRVSILSTLADKLSSGEIKMEDLSIFLSEEIGSPGQAVGIIARKMFEDSLFYQRVDEFLEIGPWVMLKDIMPAADSWQTQHCRVTKNTFTVLVDYDAEEDWFDKQIFRPTHDDSTIGVKVGQEYFGRGECGGLQAIPLHCVTHKRRGQWEVSFRLLMDGGSSMHDIMRSLRHLGWNGFHQRPSPEEFLTMFREKHKTVNNFPDGIMGILGKQNHESVPVWIFHVGSYKFMQPLSGKFTYHRIIPIVVRRRRY